MSLAANAVQGIRAVVCSEPYTARMSRLHNDTNVLCMGSRVIGHELAKMIADVWLETPFEGAGTRSALTRSWSGERRVDPPGSIGSVPA